MFWGVGEVKGEVWGCSKGKRRWGCKEVGGGVGKCMG